MLVIDNIEKLEKKTIGAWAVQGVEVDFVNMHISCLQNYVIRLDRSGQGAAIIIERNAGEFGYNVSLVMHNFNNVISINAVGKNELKNKNIFLSLMRGVLDSEYDKKK